MTDWKQLIAGCMQQQRQSQEQLYEAAYPVFMKVCLRYASDVYEAGALYNEAMLKVFNALQQYAGKGDVQAWMRRIVVNTCIDHCRKQAKFSHQSVDEAPDVFIDPEVYDRLNAREIVQLLQELPQNTALVFNLFVLEGYKHEEIATILNIAVGTSKWHLNEARRLLKSKLDALIKKETYYNETHR